MPWLKTSDTSAMHPLVLEVGAFDQDDEDLVNRVYGFLSRAAVMSAQYLTDYIISEGTLRQLATPRRFAENVDFAQKAGLLSEREWMLDAQTGRERSMYRLIQDKDLWHVRLKDEVEWERERKRHNSNPAMTMPVRQRDGDACRYCGNVVYFGTGDRKSARAGTYDHVIPQGPGGPENMVVCCQPCNSSKKDEPAGEWLARMRPVPEKPYYGPGTVEQLKKHGLEPRDGFGQFPLPDPTDGRLGPVSISATPRPNNPSAAEATWSPQAEDRSRTRVAEPETDRRTAENSPAREPEHGASGLESSSTGRSCGVEDSPVDALRAEPVVAAAEPVMDRQLPVQQKKRPRRRREARPVPVSMTPSASQEPAVRSSVDVESPLAQAAREVAERRRRELSERPGEKDLQISTDFARSDLDYLTTESGLSGSGRDGTGRDGKAKARGEEEPSPAHDLASSSSPKRRRRRSRNRKSS